MRVRVRIYWADLARDVALAVIVAVVIGLIAQRVTGTRVTLWSHVMFALAGIWWGRWLVRSSKKKQKRIGGTAPSSRPRDANIPPE